MAMTLSGNESWQVVGLDGLGRPAATTETINTQQVATFVAAGVLVDATTISWNLALASKAFVILGGNRTLSNPTSMINGGTYILIVKQDASGNRTLAYGAVYKWQSGIAPVLSTSANAIDIISFVSDGVNMYGVAQFGFA